MRFSGKCAVVTGAASGIGRETALLFAREGAQVFAADLDLAGVQALAGETAEITAVGCDVCDVAQIQALMDQAASTCGGIDILFNNAGAIGDPAPIDEIDPAGWDLTMNLLLRSVAMGIRYAVPHMKNRPSARTGGAAIVNTSSIAAISAGYSPSAYAVAKAGVLHLTRMAAADLACHGIRVNAVQPGFINTNIFAAAVGMPTDRMAAANGLVAQTSLNAQPVTRGGQPADIANAVAYLCSEAASFMTGSSMLVDGGITIGPRHSWDPEAPTMFGALRELATAPQ